MEVYIPAFICGTSEIISYHILRTKIIKTLTSCLQSYKNSESAGKGLNTYVRMKICHCCHTLNLFCNKQYSSNLSILALFKLHFDKKLQVLLQQSHIKIKLFYAKYTNICYSTTKSGFLQSDCTLN